MGFNFPNSPSLGQAFTPPGGPAFNWNGTAWLLAQGGDAIVSDNPPSPAVNGQLWFESDTGLLFIWYEDGDSGQWVQASGAVPSGQIVRTVIYTPGLTVWPKPVGLKYLDIELFGCGGAGGGAVVTVAAQASIGCGGGAGGYVRHFLAAASIPATLDVTLGFRGAGAAGVNGGAGGASSVVGTGVNLVAAGGTGGLASPAVGSFPTGYGGIGGGGSGSGGNTLNARGGFSGPASIFSAGTVLLGMSGSSMAGEGLQPSGNTNGIDCGTEDIGLGGGGCLNNASQAMRRGGHGGYARAIFTEFY